jgi:hypothetical protein
MFEVHSSSQKALAKLDFCADCREILKERGYTRDPFDLQGFLVENDAYEARKLKELAPVPEVTESSDLADACRRVCDFSCQACGVICVDVPGLLHLHYDDGDPTHTDVENLHILCVDCHASLPGHDHMKMQPVVQADIDIVAGLRRLQGIVVLQAGE